MIPLSSPLSPPPATASAEGAQLNGRPSLRERVRVRGFSHSLRLEHDYEVLELSVRKSSGDEILRAVRHPAHPVVSSLWSREPANVQVLRPVRRGPNYSLTAEG